MNISQITPMPGKILVKKLADDTTTKAGIILTTATNKQHEYVEVAKVGRNISENMNKKISVNIGDKCLVMGKGIYDSVNLDDGIYYFLNPSDIYAVLESDSN